MSNDLDDIVTLNIDREAASAVSKVAFGVPAIFGEFTTAKTTTTFDRTRSYTSLANMRADGWTTYDREYQAAAKIFSQDVPPASVLIGRKASGDSDWTAALDAIQLDNPNWYAFSIIPTKTAVFTFSGDLVTGDKVDIVINGQTIAQVSWATDMQTTMGLIKAAIELVFDGSSTAKPDATFTVGSTPYRTGTLVFANGSTPTTITVTTSNSVTTPATCAVTMDDSGAAAAYALAWDWAETQTKLFFLTTSEAHVLTADTDDMASVAKAAGLDRTVVCYNPAAMSDIVPAYHEVGWIGRMLPEDPGSADWIYKTIKGLTAVEFNPTQKSYALGKNANIYQSVAGVDVTLNGDVASGEHIDIIVGTDYMKSDMQARVFTLLTQVKKVPFTDEGIQLVVGAIRASLESAAAYGIIQKDTISISAPLAADVSDEDKQNRLLPDIKFSAQYQGAIRKTEIQGNVSV